MKILHCLIDDKFLDGVINVFNYSQVKYNNIDNHYIYIYKDKCPDEFVYVKQKDKIDLVSAENALDHIINNRFDVVVLHSFPSLPLKVISKLPRCIKLIWFAWGYDIYNDRFEHKALVPIKKYKQITQTYLRNTKENKVSLRDCLYKIKQRLIYSRLYERAISRVDYFSGVIPAEYDMLEKLPYFRAKRIDYNYFDIPSNRELSDSNGNNIIIGNSADYTNNHLDIIDILKNVDLGDRKVFIPLSYPSNVNDYVGEIVSRGKEAWSMNFVPLLSFMSYEEYRNIISSCKYAVFYHERQQAMGNIWMALNLGICVFMSKYSAAYKHLCECGFIIFSVQDDLELMLRTGQSLTNEQKMQNKELFKKYFSFDSFINKIYKIYDLLTIN